MAKFKVGDRVRVVRAVGKDNCRWADCMNRTIGNEYEVFYVDHDGDCKLKDWNDHYTYKKYYFPHESLELVERTDGYGGHIHISQETLSQEIINGLGSYVYLDNNLTKPTGKTFMSVITNAFKSKENKALEHFDLGSSCALNERGKMEFLQYLFETKTEEREAFLAKLVEAHKENKD